MNTTPNPHHKPVDGLIARALEADRKRREAEANLPRLAEHLARCQVARLSAFVADRGAMSAGIFSDALTEARQEITDAYEAAHRAYQDALAAVELTEVPL